MSLLLKFLLDLPQPLIPSDMNDALASACGTPPSPFIYLSVTLYCMFGDDEGMHYCMFFSVAKCIDSYLRAAFALSSAAAAEPHHSGVVPALSGPCGCESQNLRRTTGGTLS
jgi:hypothetical protein